MSQTQVASAIVVIKENNILMLQRKGSEGDGSWAIPGGKVDFMEDPADAVIRELKEETGLVAQEIEFIGYTSDIHPDTNKHFITLRFMCTAFSGEAVIGEPEKCTAIGWYSLEKLPKPLFGPTHKLLAQKSILKTLQKAMQ